jgi:V/A-type H+-transporting ATPase subunit I
MYKSAKAALSKKDSLSQEISTTAAEIERIEPWGSFSPSDVRELKKLGFDLHFYRVGQAECEQILQDENIKAIRLASVEKTDTLAVIGTLPPDIPATYGTGAIPRPSRTCSVSIPSPRSYPT